MDIQLFQFYHCPFCFKVREYLRFNRIKFTKTEVNPFSKGKNLNFSTYKKVPFALINNTPIPDSRLINSVIESYLCTGRPIKDIYNDYTIENAKDLNKAIFVNPFQIFDDPQTLRDLSLVEYRARELEWRQKIHNEYFILLSHNVFYTPLESIRSSMEIAKHGNYTFPQSLLVRILGGPVMYIFNSLRAKKFDGDARDLFYKACSEWVAGLEGENFNGGSQPNIADIEMYALFSSIKDYNLRLTLSKVYKLEEWLKRMKEYL